MPSSAALTRQQRAERNRGRPTLSFDGLTPYADYTGVSTLLSLQRPRTDEPAETTFLIATQVMELLFALIRHEWEQARAAVDADNVPAALAALRRGHKAQDVLVESWELLAPMTPTEFNQFRDQLGEASGFQSYGYRHLEFLLGNKSAAMIRPHRADPRASAELQRALAEPEPVRRGAAPTASARFSRACRAGGAGLDPASGAPPGGGARLGTGLRR